MTWAMALLIGLLCGSLCYRAGLRRRLRLQAALDEARSGREALQRSAGLAGRDLRDAALRLTGEAGALAARPGAGVPDVAARLAAAALRCRLLADDLGSAGGTTSAAMLDEQRVDLNLCVQQAVESIAAALLPGRRCFDLPAQAVAIVGDRRAVRHVVGRVLTEAVLNSREGDCITVTIEPDASGGIALVVADEGMGVLAADADSASEPIGRDRDSRGLGVGLALSRALMEAHGGRLEVIAAPGTGTRASLIFPPPRCPA